MSQTELRFPLAAGRKQQLLARSDKLLNMDHGSSSQNAEQAAFYLDQSSLECKAGCGFFGNPEWLGYCSICFKQLRTNPHLLHSHHLNHHHHQQQQPGQQHSLQYQEQQQQQQTLVGVESNQNVEIESPTPAEQPQTKSVKVAPSTQTDWPHLKLGRLILNTVRDSSGDTPDRREQQPSNRRSIRNWPIKLPELPFQNMSLSFELPNPLQPSSPSKSEQQTNHSQHNQTPPPSEEDTASADRPFSHMLNQVTAHTVKFAKEFLHLERASEKGINELSDMVHDFYQSMSDRINSHFIFKGVTTEQVEQLNDHMEHVLNGQIYQAISARIINEDEDHNMAIQRRIRSLNWITVEHLEISIDFGHPNVHDLLDQAICQMVEMNSKTSSIEKLDCIVQCSKTIFQLLQVNPPSGKSVPVSADQFLPVLVFVVIQANPPMLPADMRYLTRFSNPRRLMSGETGYYFTNLCCALEFIEKASGASLNIGEEEFNRYMRGEAVPETNSLFSTYLCDGLRTMCSNSAALSDLQHRNEARQSKIDNLLEQIDVHMETNRAKLKEMQTYANDLKRRLQVGLPKIFYDIKSQNQVLANRLLPSYLRRQKELPSTPTPLQTKDSEVKLVDIETASECIADLSLNSFSSAMNTPLSPVERLESDICSATLPDPIKPEPANQHK